MTGGFGFVGSALVNHLVESHEVTVLARPRSSPRRLRGLSPRVVSKDLSKITAADVAESELVIHAASLVDSSSVTRSPNEDVAVNVAGTMRLLEACKEVRPRVVLLSSDHVYGNPGSSPVDERSSCEPTSLYGATKMCAERMTLLHAQAHHYEAVVVRLTNVYGAEGSELDVKTSVLNHFIARAIQGDPLELHGGGAFRRDFLHLSDAVLAVVVASRAGEPGGTYLAASGESRPFRDVVRVVHERTGGRSRWIDVPAPPAGLRSVVADSSKLRAIGWTPRVSLEDGIARTLAAAGYRTDPADGAL